MGDNEATNAKKVCHVCNGFRNITCTQCQGLGQIPDPNSPGSYLTCPNGGNGQMTCTNCNGTGWEP
jgi:hypothetical protein